MLHPDTVTQRYGRLARRVGVDTHLHCLRHYSATELKVSGVAADASFDKISERPPPATSPFDGDHGLSGASPVTPPDQAIDAAGCNERDKVASDSVALYAGELHRTQQHKPAAASLPLLSALPRLRCGWTCH